jgi:multicomponent Na+:H+ antiporter subunit E
LILLLTNIFLAIAWGAVSGSFSVLNLMFGFVLGILALSLIREQVGSVGYFARARRVLALTLLFLKELLLSAWKVATTVMSPDMGIRPGIIALPLDVKKDGEIALLANMITLTPGTLSLDVSEDKSVLYIHALDCSDPEALKLDIKNGFEAKIAEAFR